MNNHKPIAFGAVVSRAGSQPNVFGFESWKCKDVDSITLTIREFCYTQLLRHLTWPSTSSANVSACVPADTRPVKFTSTSTEREALPGKAS